METRQMTPFFHLLFPICLSYSFLNLKILIIHFHVLPSLVHSGLQNTTIFVRKLPIQTAHHTFRESRRSEVTKNLYYVSSTRRSQIPIFLGSSSWTVRCWLLIKRQSNFSKNTCTQCIIECGDSRQQSFKLVNVKAHNVKLFHFQREDQLRIVITSI